MTISRLSGAVLAIMAMMVAGHAGAAEPSASEKARIGQAVKAYADKLESDHRNEIDQRIANAADALNNDPASPVIGNPNGDVTIVEFFDYACPYCKAIEPRLEVLLNSDRKVKLVLKEFPILTPASMIATKAALASVHQGKYRQFHQAMMRFEGQLHESDIFDTAKSVGLDVQRLKKDMEAPEITAQIIANFNLARSIRAFQTPTFIAANHELSSTSASIDFPRVVAAARGK